MSPRIPTLWPFGTTLVRRTDAGVVAGARQHAGVLFCGGWLAIAHIVAGPMLCATIIGIPLGVPCFKPVQVSFWPLGQKVVSVDLERELVY